MTFDDFMAQGGGVAAADEETAGSYGDYYTSWGDQDSQSAQDWANWAEQNGSQYGWDQAQYYSDQADTHYDTGGGYYDEASSYGDSGDSGY